MKASVFTKFDRLMAAVTFAESAEFETAQEFLRKEDGDDKQPAAMPDLGMHPSAQTSR